MKLTDLVHLLGWRGPVQTYGHEIRAFVLEREGRIEYAQWLHPGETAKVIRQDAVDHLRTFLQPGDVAIDVGAHTGDSTIPIALAVGPAGTVLALEPNPYVYRVLERNAALNPDKTHIVPLPFAATPTSGDVEFEYSDAGFCNGGRHEGISRWRHGHAFRLRVRGENLPEWLQVHHPALLPRIKYIKVDAEGYDLTVLESLASLVEATRPVVRAEVFKLTGRAQREALIRFFESRRYVVRRIEHDAAYRGPVVTSSSVPAAGHFDIFAEPA